MANPKWKTPRSKTRSRRAANWKLNPVAVVECAHCHQPKRAHFVCPNCGYHGGRLAVEPVDDNTSASR